MSNYPPRDGTRVPLEIDENGVITNPANTIQHHNRRLVNDLVAATDKLIEAERELVEAYQQMVVMWQGDTEPPLKHSKESVDFFKHVGFVQKGIEGLQALIHLAQQRKLF